MSTRNCLYVYHFTLKSENKPYKDVIETLNKFCKKWVFQLEESETGYKHYQGIVSLSIRRRLQELIKYSNKFETLSGIHYSPSTTRNINDWSYAEKVQTRIDGPWKHTDKPIYIPKQIRDIDKFREWQASLLEIIKKYNNRNIILVYDPMGNSGKSTFSLYCLCMKLGKLIPSVNNYKEFCQITYGLPDSKLYIIDFPRALPKWKLREFYSGIETLKNGYLFDTRYNFRSRLIDSPQIIIFTNKLPKKNFLSIDRYEIYTIKNNKLLRESTSILDENSDEDSDDL